MSLVNTLDVILLNFLMYVLYDVHTLIHVYDQIYQIYTYVL